MQPDPALYSFINQGVLTVNGIDDVEEMGLTDVSDGLLPGLGLEAGAGLSGI